MPVDSKTVCYQFRDSGFCSYGSRCKFSHTRNIKKVRPPWQTTVFQARCTFVANNLFAFKERKRPQFHLTRQKRRDLDAISTFFSQYPAFAYDAEQDVAQEFYRMCDFFAWDRDSDERKKARQAFKDAMVIRFNGLYGTDTSDIENWHKLCVAVRIEPLPSTIAKCKEKIKRVHVNLVDLVDTSGRRLDLFSSLDELSEYTIETGKFFPKESAYAGGVLKFLLREIL